MADLILLLDSFGHKVKQKRHDHVHGDELNAFKPVCVTVTGDHRANNNSKEHAPNLSPSEGQGKWLGGYQKTCQNYERGYE
jgi:hypothetical protein